MHQRTSVLSAFSFLSGLLAALSATAAWLLYYIGDLGQVCGMAGDDQQGVWLAARIVAGATVLPAVFALAFWLGARGAVRESGGALTGRGLYRTGMLLACGAVLASLGGRWSVSARAAGAMETSKLTPEERLQRAAGLETDAWTASLVQTLRVQSMDTGRHAVLETAIRDRKLEPGQLCAILETFAMDHERLQAARFCVPDKAVMRFSVEEVVALCRAFSMDSNRLAFLDLVAPGLVDMDKSHRILEAFDQSHSKTTAARTIKEKGGTNVARETGHGWLGAEVRSLPEGGVQVASMLSYGPAASAGLRVGDVVTHVDGKGVRTQEELVAAIRARAPGTKAPLTVRRGSATVQVEVGLGRAGGKKAEEE